MAINIQTRSKYQDYSHFGIPKGDTKWWHFLKNDIYTDDSNDIIIEFNNGRWSVFVDKIPSNRCDGTPTKRPIVYSIDGSGSFDDDAEKNDWSNISKMICSVLLKSRESIDYSSLGALFNESFDEFYINSIDSNRNTEGVQNVVRNGLDNVFSKIEKCSLGIYEDPQMDNKTLKVLRFNSESMKHIVNMIQKANVVNMSEKYLILITTSIVTESFVEKLISMGYYGWIVSSANDEQSFWGVKEKKNVEIPDVTKKVLRNSKVLIIIACLGCLGLFWLAISGSSEKSINKSNLESSENCETQLTSKSKDLNQNCEISQMFNVIGNDSLALSVWKQQLKDSTIKYQYQPLLLEYDSASHSIMIIRNDSTRSMFFSLE